MSVEKIVSEILVAEDDRISALANRLIREIKTDEDTHAIGALFNSDRPDIVGVGLFVATEIGPKGRTLWQKVLPFATHAKPFFRGCFVNFCRSSEVEDELILNQILKLIEDKDIFVALQLAMFFLGCSEKLLSDIFYGKYRIMPNDIETEISYLKENFCDDERMNMFISALLLRNGADLERIKKILKLDDYQNIEKLAEAHRIIEAVRRGRRKQMLRNKLD